MALVLADRVQEYSTTTGTGTLTLSGAYAGFQTFAAGIGNGNTCYYTITSDTNQWEVGIGTVGVGTLARTTLISSSTGSFVAFSGTLTVFVTYPAEKAVYSDGGSLGATTVGGNFFTLTNPSAVTFPRINADNTVSALDSSSFRSAIGAGTITSVTGTAPVVSSGGTTPAISMAAATTSTNGYLTSTDWNTFNNKGSGTVTSVTATSPVTSTGGTAPVIAMPAATTSVNGYLTSTDWNTFNGKYSVGGALGTPSSGTVTNLTGTASININGTVGATTQSTGAFTTLRSTGSTLLGGASGFEQLRVVVTASRSQYIQISANTSSNIQKISVVGSSNLGLACQGGGNLRFNTEINDTLTQFVINHVASAVNYLSANGAATGNFPSFNAEGSDANINIRFTPKGTGTVQFGTHTATVLTPTGFITITDAGGTSRRLLVG